jgi:peroxiredoxin Q/BCP
MRRRLHSPFVALAALAAGLVPAAARAQQPSPAWSAGLVKDPEVGGPAPRFSLPWADRERVSGPGFEYNSRQDAGKVVILVFYPQDRTPSGDAMVQALRQRYADLTGQGAVLFGVAPDSAHVHQRYARQFDLPFRLLSDPGLSMARSYGVALPFGQNLRSAFVIARDGTVAYKDLHFEAQGTKSYDALVQAVRRAMAPPPEDLPAPVVRPN